ncbi:MAG: FtsX-like permease family protein [candidate division Zixibacteria bacterium]|nr:FtsX-like permease family protein [candidate division Zixibacteria bacterium]
MGLLTFLRYFWNDFRKQKKRATLTVAAIVWGTMSILLLLAFGEGLKRQLDRNQRGLGENIMIVWGGQTSMPYEGLPRGRRIRFMEEDVDVIQKSIPQIENIGAEYSRWGVDVVRGSKVLSEHVCGEYPTYEQMRAHYPMQGGRYINWTDMEEKRRVIFLGYEMKQKLFGDEDATGQTVHVSGIPFTVIGVGQDKQQMGMYGGPDVSKGSMPATTFKSLFGHKYLSNLVIQPRSTNLNEVVERRLNEVLGARLKFHPDDEQALSIWDTIEGRKAMQNMMLGMQIFMGIIGAMTLLIAGVGVANIMYVVIKERTKEIGIKMALGGKPRIVQWQFLLEAMIICFSGGVIGIFISQLICDLMSLIPREEGSSMTWLGNPTISLPIGMITIAILAIIAVIAGYFPSRRAAMLNPAETLRYE